MVHSVIVFQHIPPEVGIEIAKKLLKRVNETGSFYLHFNTGYVSPSREFSSKLKQRFPVIQYAYNIARRRPRNEPPMQMYQYSEKHLIELMESEGFTVSVAGRTVTSVYRGVTLVGTRA